MFIYLFLESLNRLTSTFTALHTRPCSTTPCPPETNRGEDHEDDGITRGYKFRILLKCFKRTGNVCTCTHQNNTFLAWERAAFCAALPIANRRFSAAQFSSHPHAQSSPPPKSPPKSLPPNQPYSHSQAPPSAPTSSPFTTWLSEIFGRAVDKHAHPCVELLRTFGESDIPTHVIDVC